LTAMTKLRGVYFLANDRIIDLVIAFLNSFRKHNPTMPLCLIPFDANVDRVVGLRATYDFSVFSNADALKRCDEIGVRLSHRFSGLFRKFALWEGDFDEFLYIDADTIVLEAVDFVFDFLSEYDFLTSHSDIPAIRKYVWRDSVYKTRALTTTQINYAANMGFLCSRKSALTLNRVDAKLPAAVEISPHMETRYLEQPFLNYMIVTSGGRYSSLLTIARQNRRPDIPLERWAGKRIGLVYSGRIIFPSIPRALLVHWAGEWQPRSFDHRIASLRKTLGLGKYLPCVRHFMPKKRLWNHYRHMRD
jgi:hypothetical protein